MAVRLPSLEAIFAGAPAIDNRMPQAEMMFGALADAILGTEAPKLGAGKALSNTPEFAFEGLARPLSANELVKAQAMSRQALIKRLARGKIDTKNPVDQLTKQQRSALEDLFVEQEQRELERQSDTAAAMRSSGVGATGRFDARYGTPSSSAMTSTLMMNRNSALNVLGG